MDGSNTGRLLNAIRLTWIIFICVAAAHLYIQHRMMQGLISDLIEVNTVAHAALMTAESRASKAEILADIAVLKVKVQTIHDIVVKQPGTKVSIQAAPTQADAAVTPHVAGSSSGGRRGKRK
jgi:hypothetical protein